MFDRLVLQFILSGTHYRIASFYKSCRLSIVLVPVFLIAVGVRPLSASAQAIVMPTVIGDHLSANDLLTTPQWDKASAVSMEHEITYGKFPSGETTSMRFLTDRTYLYVRYDVSQSSPITDTQRTDGIGWGTDDGVGIVLWPGGRSGYSYTFESNPSGTHYQYSTENTAFHPNWFTVGRRTAAGYEVVLQIPLSILKGDGRDQWLMNLYRTVARTTQMFVWSYSPQEGRDLGSQYAGVLSGMKTLSKSDRKKAAARASIYGLGEVQPSSYGGSTSRIGGDFSVLVAPRISVFGTVHPDYSNVEVDQQTIAPTQFPRVYYEVRPFFTQAQSFYNPSGFSDLYTPAIPAPSWGLAFEGISGLFQAAGFDAQSSSRDDNAFVSSYTTPNQALGLSFQRVQASYSGVFDATTTESAAYNNQHDLTIYGSTATDSGTNDLQANMNHNSFVGTSLYGPKANLTLNYLSTDLYYNPVDGYVAHPDVHGFNYSGSREFDFTPTSAVIRVSAYAYGDLYRDHLGSIDQSDDYLSATVTTKRMLSISMSTGSNYLFEQGFGMTPFTQQGPTLSWALNPALPSDIGVRDGHYYNGLLHSDFADSTIALGRASRSLTFNYYATDFDSPTVRQARQTLFRAAINWQLAKTGSVTLGWRQISGSQPYFSPQPYVKGDNFSAAYVQRLSIGNLYLVYGDPNAFSTQPSFILKFVHYILGQEGT